MYNFKSDEVNNTAEPTQDELLKSKFCKDVFLSEHSVEVFIKSVKLYNHIGKLCWQKNAIFEHLTQKRKTCVYNHDNGY